MGELLFKGNTLNSTPSDSSLVKYNDTTVKAKLDELSTPNIDEFLSEDSSNAVQNKVVSNALYDLENNLNLKLDTKQDTLTAGSNITIENNVISARGSEIGGGFDFVRILGADDDLNNIIETGFYNFECNPDKMPTNTPWTNMDGSYGLLEVYDVPNMIVQSVTKSINGMVSIYKRRYSKGASSWSNWKRFLDDSDTIPNIATMGQVEGFHNGNMDWNNYRNPGLYRVGDLSRYSNYPSGAGSWGQLIVSTGGDTTSQIYIPYATTDRMYYRCFSHSTPPSGVGWVAMSTTATKLARNGNIDTPMQFNWSGQGGQPTWLWGGNDADPSNMYVYNPSNFTVSGATWASRVGHISQVKSGLLESNDSVDIYMPNSSSFLIFTSEMASNTGAYRGHHCYLLHNPSVISTIQTVTLGASTNSGVTITRPANADTFNIKATNGYRVFYKVYSVNDNQLNY